jgi:hypothetical protein
MQDNKFWRLVGVCLVAALFYVGHGLHNGHDAPPSLFNTAFAGGAGVHPGIGQYGIYTSSQDGNILYCWGHDGKSGGASFMGAAKIDGKFIRGPARVEAPTDGNTKHAIP